MTQSVFAVDGDDLVSLTPGQFRDEDELQALLKKHPELLGTAAARESGVSLLLVDRELGIPDDEAGSNRWPIDHVFVDESGIPVLVEVKRSANPELRRKVIGQLLEYAANGPRYWPPNRLRETYEQRCAREDLGPDVHLGDVLGAEVMPDAFWTEVDENLRSGRIRLLFVADRIPAELASVIEFLGGQMSPAEVLGVEIRKFQAEDGKTMLAPHVIGPTETAIASRVNRGANQGSQRVDDITFFKDVMSQENYESLRATFDAVNEALAKRNLPWTPNLFEWRITWHRPGAGTGTFKACEIDAKRRDPIRFGFNLPDDPAQLDGGLENPFPELRSRWEYGKWQWEIPDVSSVPEIGEAVDLCSRYHQGTGPASIPSS